MSRKTVSALMMFLLVLGTLTLAFKIQPVKSQPTTIIVPDDYPTIQAAIDAANDGDTIYVRNGIYNEHLEVNKTLTLMGESNQNTIIEAQGDPVGNAWGVYITSSNTVIEGFKIIPDPNNPADLVVVDGRNTGCSNDLVRNNTLVFTLDTGSQGAAVDIFGSENNMVEDNQIMIGSTSDAGTNGGIVITFFAGNNTVLNNTIIGGWVGITCVLSSNNVLSNNYLTGQTLSGGYSDIGALALIESSGDIIKGNTLINNTLGLSFSDVDCSVYHNNFINNTQQVLTERNNQIAFNNGYPSGGNYWSDYIGTDTHNGPGQNITGSDGIGDTPYIIDSNNLDNYPLMAQWTPPNLVGDLNGDGKVNLADLVMLANAYGSKPGDPNWNPDADFAPPYGIISLTDLVTLAMHYGTSANAFADKVLFVTSMGNITIQLFDDMPITVANFKNLVSSGAYDGTIFHRVVPGFVIQGGDLTSKGINWSTIPDENIGLHSNLRGAVAMAKTSQPNSASSQFFINLNDSNAANLDYNYSVFGQVISGMDIVDAISHAPTNPPNDGQALTNVTLILAQFIS